MWGMRNCFVTVLGTGSFVCKRAQLTADGKLIQLSVNNSIMQKRNEVVCIMNRLSVNYVVR